MQDLNKRLERIISWLQEAVGQAGARGAVLGLSGGIDSSVVAMICREAFGDQALGLILPCHTPAQEIEDAHRAAKGADIRTEVVDLTPLYDLLLQILPTDGKLARANLQPRLRMTVLYYFANVREALVIGTSNASERAVGYYTKYGDGGTDLLPIGGLTKTEVRQLAEILGVPRRIIEKPPSAGLWEGQTDERELGFTYDELDRFLTGGSIPLKVAERINRLIEKAQHKRTMPPLFEDL